MPTKLSSLCTHVHIKMEFKNYFFWNSILRWSRWKFVFTNSFYYNVSETLFFHTPYYYGVARSLVFQTPWIAVSE